MSLTPKTGRSRSKWQVGVWAVLAMFALVASACGGDDNDTSSEPSGSDDATTEETETDGSDDSSEPDDAESSGDGTGTVTMADDTEYTFTMATCDTNSTDPDAFGVDPGYDLFGKSDDGFQIQLIRAGFDEADAVTTTTFEGGFDDNGANSTITYHFMEDPEFSVDGGNVSGTVTLENSLGGDPIHGESIEATVDISC